MEKQDRLRLDTHTLQKCVCVRAAGEEAFSRSLCLSLSLSPASERASGGVWLRNRLHWLAAHMLFRGGAHVLQHLRGSSWQAGGEDKEEEEGGVEPKSGGWGGGAKATKRRGPPEWPGPRPRRRRGRSLLLQMRRRRRRRSYRCHTSRYLALYLQPSVSERTEQNSDSTVRRNCEEPIKGRCSSEVMNGVRRPF